MRTISRMQLPQLLHVNTPYCHWYQLSFKEVTDCLAEINARLSIPPFSSFSWDMREFQDLLKRQEGEILAIDEEGKVLLKYPARPDNPFFYFQRERWLEAYNKLQFWKCLPGGREYLEPDLGEGREEALALQLRDWMLERPEILDLKRFGVVVTDNTINITRIPSEVGLLTQLEEFAIMNTSIQELPSEIGELAQLKILMMRNNRLRCLCPELQKLQNLETLDLSSNQLEDIDLIGSLRKLRCLYGGNNQIIRLPARMEWSQIERISLMNNQLNELSEDFYRLTSLTCIELSDNKLCHISEKIVQLRELRSLYLSGNLVTRLPSELKYLKELHFIDVCENQLTELPPELAEMPSLSSILLCGNPILQRPIFLPTRIWTGIIEPQSTFL